jgi:dihydroorotate dehydrogenase (fumarate)
MDLPKDLIISNAAGIVKTLEHVEMMCRSVATRIVVGSITKEPRTGNAGNTYYYDEKTKASVNALGMDNYGIKKYREILPTMEQMARDSGKELWVSIAGFSSKEFAELTEACVECGMRFLKLNLGCPNIHDEGKTKPIFSYVPHSTAQVLAAVRDTLGRKANNVQIAAKISPVPDEILEELSFEIARSGIVTEVVACNTLPNQSLKREDGSEGLNFVAPGDTEKKHAGGGGGSLVHKESLRVVEKLTYGWLPAHIRTVFAGGIHSGKTLARCLEEDIAGFECATSLWGSLGKLNPRVLSDIIEEYVGLPEPTLKAYVDENT